jgi:hypothetical protein
MRGQVECISGTTGSQQSSIQIICPLMVRAHEPWRYAATRFADLRTTVTAAVMKAHDVSVLSAQDQDWRAPYSSSQIRARRTQFDLEADHMPVSVEDRLQIKLIDLGIDVKRLRQAMMGLTLM